MHSEGASDGDGLEPSPGIPSTYKDDSACCRRCTKSPVPNFAVGLCGKNECCIASANVARSPAWWLPACANAIEPESHQHMLMLWKRSPRFCVNQKQGKHAKTRSDYHACKDKSSRAILQSEASTRRPVTLSARKREVLQLIAEGKNTKEIGES